MNPKVSFLASLLATLITIALFSLSLGPLPPAGSFFHPGTGFWANAETDRQSGSLVLSMSGINEPVEIFYNERGVPHIFAGNNYDLYFAQGYVTARDRLFQLELQVRASEGSLSEWFGEDLLEYDLVQRRMGMVYGAEQTLTTLQGDEIEEMLNAYTDGINQYILNLNSGDLPVEYKILNTKPSEWSQLKSALLLKYMTQMLAGGSHDVQTSNTMAFLGQDFVEEYISTPSRWTDPIIPSETTWDFEPIYTQSPADNFTPEWVSGISPFETDPAVGSNNWVVDGSKTASGNPILAGDPHLGLSIPSIWYEMQLNAPGINVYGVTIPGSPSVIKGFNSDIAWLNTNTGADVLDWYEIEFRDESRNQYLHDGEWKPVHRRTEEIRIRDGKTVTDTLLFTHHGPIVQPDENKPDQSNFAIGHAIRWIGHEPSDELRAYYQLNRAPDVEEASNALSYFSAPSQNFALADRHGTIAMQIGGKLPLRWHGQGRTISDGRNAAYDWQGWIPFEQNPKSINPGRGFVSSANQYPTNDDYPYYLGDYFAPFERGTRINEKLENLDDITIEEMRLLQLDNYSYHAELALPHLLSHIHTEILDDKQSEILSLLNQWEYKNLGDDIAPTIFYTWWNQLYSKTWRILEHDEPMRRPQRDRTLQKIIEEPVSPFYGDVINGTYSSLSELITAAYKNSVDELTRTYGEDFNQWKWGFVNETNLNHLGQFPGLGEYNLFTDGGAESPNAIRGSHGPSWRMIVELGNTPKAYGVYPGGQSGNPGSPHYNEFTDTWIRGELYELKLLENRPVRDNETFPFFLRME
jgi:penicillin G amidase